MDHFFIALSLILIGSIIPLLGVRKFSAMKAVAVAVAGLGCLLGLVDAVIKLFQPGVQTLSVNYLNTLAFAFRIDALSAFFLVAIFGVSLLATIYSYNYLSDPKKTVSDAVHYIFFGLLIIAMALVVAADNMISFLLAWELMSLSSFFLVIYDYQKPENRKAGYLYFVFSHVGAMFIIAAFGLLYAYSGSLNFAATTNLTQSAKVIVFVLAFIGFGSKAGIFPFHVWLPHAHPAAPSHISAIMSGVMIKTGIYGIVRIYALLNTDSQVFGSIVLIVGIISGIMGVVYALGQSDLKRLLAYSSIENIGIILIGLGIGMLGVAAGQPIMAVLGFSGGLLHVLNHAIFKALLFLGAGMVIKKTGTRTIEALGGLIKNMKVTGVTFLIGSLAVAGLPPFNGFVSEFIIYLGGFRGITLEPGIFMLTLLAIVGLAIIGGLALACFTRVVGIVFQGEPRTANIATADEKGPTMLIAMAVLSAVCIVIGLFPNIFFVMALKAVAAIGLPYGRIPLSPFMEITANITRFAGLFILILLIVWGLRSFLYKNKKNARSGTWGCGFTQPTVRMQYTGSSYAASILEFFKPVAPLTEKHPPVAGLFPKVTNYQSHIDDIAERHMQGVIVKPILALFDKLRWIQHGDIHLYIGYILLAIVVLLFFV